MWIPALSRPRTKTVGNTAHNHDFDFTAARGFYA